MKKKMGIAIGTVVCATVLGFGIYKSDASGQDPKLSVDDINKMVTAQYPGEITEIELDKERNKVVYEVEVFSNGKEYDLKLDGNTGEVLKLKEKTVLNKGNIALDGNNSKNDDKTNSTQDTNENQKNNQTNAGIEKNKKEIKSENKTVIDSKKAIEIAKSQFSGTVTDLELDEDDGRLIYEIEIKNGKEEADFEIDAYTGEILVIDIDLDDEDDND